MTLASKILKSRYLTSVNLINVCLFVTYRCSANCLFCELGNKATERSELDLSELKRVIRELRSLDVRRISLVGGEPLLRNDLPEIIECVRKNQMSISLTTNGFQIREDVLKSKPNEINVSLDFVDSRHEKYRRVPDAFDKVRKSLDFYLRNRDIYNYKLGITTVLMKENLDSIYEVVKFASELNVDKVGIQPLIIPQIRDDEKIDKYFSEEELITIEETLNNLKRKYPKLITTSRLFLNSVPDYFRGPGKHKLFCFAGGTMLNIDPTGEVFPCLFMESAGNLQEHSLLEILTSQKFKDLHASASKRKCPDCLCPDIFEPNLLLHPFHWQELVKKYLTHRS